MAINSTKYHNSHNLIQYKFGYFNIILFISIALYIIQTDGGGDRYDYRCIYVLELSSDVRFIKNSYCNDD